MLLFLQEKKEEDCSAPQVIRASLESSGPGDSDSLHLQLLPFLTGRDSSVGEGRDPNQKEEFPPGGACVGSQRPLLSACPHLPKALSWAQGFSIARPGAAWLVLLPIVYSEGVIHKNSRTTTILFLLLSLTSGSCPNLHRLQPYS